MRLSRDLDRDRPRSGMLTMEHQIMVQDAGRNGEVGEREAQDRVEGSFRKASAEDASHIGVSRPAMTPW